MRTRDKVAVLLLVALCFAVVFFKIHRLGPSVAALLPEKHYQLLFNMQLDGHGEDVRVSAALPLQTGRQSVRDELVSSSEFRFHIDRKGPNRWGVWERDQAERRHVLVYSCVVRTEARRYELAPEMELPARYPAAVQAHLLSSDTVQSGSNEIRTLLDRLVPEPERRNLPAIVRASFDYCREDIKPVEIKGTTDALTALRLGEASCGGKSRLFAALLRTGGVPARLVGGLILKEGSWTSSHIWAEARLGGHWVPFCPLNGYFAESPPSYLTLYYGDEPLFTRTRDVNFRYFFHGKEILAPPAVAGAPPAGIFNLWAAFEQVGIPVNLLKIILMIPLGALVVVLARNVVGIQTFGTFMPALMAVAFRDTGLAWGIVLFLAVLAVGTAVRVGLERFQLLHTPRLAVLLTTTVIFILGVAVISVTTGRLLPTRISLFPLVILTLTIERFTLISEQDGMGKALGISLGTMLVVAAAYLVMEWSALQVVVLAFPETLLLAVAGFFVVGRWTGMRLSEYLRFREFLAPEGHA